MCQNCPVPKRRIAILPTGEWSEVTTLEQVVFIDMTTDQMNMLHELSETQITSLSPYNLDELGI